MPIGFDVNSLFGILVTEEADKIYPKTELFYLSGHSPPTIGLLQKRGGTDRYRFDHDRIKQASWS
jgi:hypothetical protein